MRQADPRWLFACVLIGCSSPDGVPEAPEDAAPTEAAPADPVHDAASGVAGLAPGDGVAEALTRIGYSLKAGRVRTEKQPKDWSGPVKIAASSLSRARLTGDYDDYAEAESALTLAFERAGEGAGPFVLRAKLNATLHRLDRVDADLDTVKNSALPAMVDGVQARLQRAALHFQRGEIDDAKRGYTAALAINSRSTGPAAGLAQVHWKTGDFETADGLYGDLLHRLRKRPGEPLCWTHLQLGLMDLDRGRYVEALAHYRDADAALPGYWLIHEHIAEVTLLLGHRAAAAALYDKVIEDTGSPEFLDARAAMHLEDGDEAAAKALIDRARAAYEARLERFPEATYGHALGHFLEFGPPDRAVDLAQKNYALRQNGDAQTQLIEAWLQVGRHEDAAALADEFAETPWRIAKGHAAMSAAYAAVGRAEDAATQRAAALAINPRTFD
jgi:tetratricopeptide (TPR) repeat protein